MGFTSLRTAIVAFVVFPCLLAMGLIGWAGLRGLEEQVDARMQEDLELIARTLRLPLSQALSRGQPGVIQDTIDSTLGIDQVYAVYVYDEDGRQVARSGRRAAAVPTAEAAELAARHERQAGTAPLGEDQLYSVFQPLTGDGARIFGLLQVTRHSGAVQEYLARVRWLALAGIAAVGLLFTGMIIAGHHFGVGRHVQRLESGMRRIREGDLGHRLQLRGAAEFRHLARGINRMLDGITASQREIERRRVTETTLREQLHHAEKMATIGSLAAGVAHELGSPLATLDGRAQQLLRAAPEGSTQRAALLDIRQSAGRMEQTIRQLMDFGRANPPQRSDVALPALLRRVAHEAGEQAGAGLRVDVGIDPAIAARDTIVSADPLRLEQALRNLLDNAVQAARTRVVARLHADPAALRIAVADDGPGVPDELQEKIFDPFYTTKPIGQGTGLGLNVASAVAAEHGGRLTLARDALGGARFTLYLPRESVDGPA